MAAGALLTLAPAIAAAHEGGGGASAAWASGLRPPALAAGLTVEPLTSGRAVPRLQAAVRGNRALLTVSRLSASCPRRARAACVRRRVRRALLLRDKARSRAAPRRAAGAPTSAVHVSEAAPTTAWRGPDFQTASYLLPVNDGGARAFYDSGQPKPPQTTGEGAFDQRTLFVDEDPSFWRRRVGGVRIRIEPDPGSWLGLYVYRRNAADGTRGDLVAFSENFGMPAEATIHGASRAYYVVLLAHFAATGSYAASVELFATSPRADPEPGDLITPNLQLVSHHPINGATGLAERGELLLVGSRGGFAPAPGIPTVLDDGGVHVFNSGNPGGPTYLAHARCVGHPSEVASWRDLIVQAVDFGGEDPSNCELGRGLEGVRIFDATDLANPGPLAFVETFGGAHTVTAVGDTGLVYVSPELQKDGGGLSPAGPPVRGFSIVDLRALGTPQQARFVPFTDMGPLGSQSISSGTHEIAVDTARELAFVAAIEETLIVDVADPRAPRILSIIRDPLISYSHGASTGPARPDILIIADENLAAGCAETGSRPVGALWFYDIAGVREGRQPKRLAFFVPPDSVPGGAVCTAHDFRAFEDRTWVATAWYSQGMFVVDYGALPQDFDPAFRLPIVARYRPADAFFWSARPHRGLLYATNADPAGTRQGLFTLRLDGYDR